MLGCDRGQPWPSDFYRVRVLVVSQTTPNLRRSLRNATAGAGLIQTDGLDIKSATDVAASLADALEELSQARAPAPSKIDKDGKRYDTIRAVPYQDPQQEAERLKAVHEARVKIVPRV